MKYSELKEGPLQRPNLLKNPSRLQALIAKIEKGEPFVLAGQDTPSVVLKKDPEVLDNLKKGIIPDKFELEDGRTVRLSGLEKTGEFGGKGAGFSTRDEDAALRQINDMVAKMLNGNSEVELVIGDKKVNVAKFVSTPGTPKSDFHAVDASGNEVAWLSHKKGSKAKDFGQWGGMSDREMKAVYKNMPEAKEEILKFAKDVIDKYPDGAIPRATTLARKISNGKLRGIAIYGNGFGGDRDNFGVKGARFSIYPAGGRKISEWI